MRLLDLFCGAGGCSVGYNLAGFDVTGVDIEDHPDYPFDLIVADAMDILRDKAFLDTFDVTHCSFPCQGYSKMAPPDNTHPRLIAPGRQLLKEWGGAYVIENIPDARAEMDHPALVCGQALGLSVRRHRLFESNAYLFSTPCVHPRTPIGVYGDHPEDSPNLRPNGTSRGVRARTLAEGQAAMGIDWMDWDDLTEAIPPRYTEFVGGQVRDYLEVAA